MPLPPIYREPAPAVASDIAPASRDRFPSHRDDHFGRSISMSIPGVDSRPDAPPPLPPPRNPPCTDKAYQSDEMFGGRKDLYHQHQSSLGSSGYGSAASSVAEDRFRTRFASREDRDEGYSSWSSVDKPSDSYPSGFRLHTTHQFRPPAEIHGDSMKQKLNPLRMSEKSIGSPFLTIDKPRPRPMLESRHLPELAMPTNLPMHQRMLDSPADTPLISAMSPRSAPFEHFGGEYRSPRETDTEQSPQGRSYRTNSDDASSTQGSYGFGGHDDMELDDPSSVKRLHMDDGYGAGGQGQKRRAPSPLAMDSTAASHVEYACRREGRTRGSPAPRLTTSGSTPTVSRSNSYLSSVSLAPTSTATMTTFEHRSPGAYSSGTVSPTSATSPYATTTSLNPSPKSSASSRAPGHGRNTSSVAARRVPSQPQAANASLQSFGPSMKLSLLMCECCPKKPRKFDTEEELKAHTAEKQYNCQYCGNRFKNKNEAERHQNSLHVRSHSWSCSALSAFELAFHEATARPGEADTCGYCGVDFPRSGVAANGSKVATPSDWDERMFHLNDTHKFRQCNLSKKFFRADHFRQHLKHSHAGLSGKWTNLLENACMIEEEPPVAPAPR
ncbi:uncharacterized protein J7T54_000771 [Emericellopsis cladophorae]|uniref:C2H2-type domain-containing protein n=1 Tax=Emericellopsis cladophorae TaxID=2686198 RepID=A0A9P9XVS2_9HYPO|nr:uncharacterized protein J7T54_000771 [Emericellopsis cladophorae]KAI6778737.1 hypothetical protein J7T54_000771 [Emericellopsis cladophorae]